jgi:mannose-6-phosphate isomerase-like protein (cupin superfamily)
VNAALWHEDFVVSDGWREDSLPADNSRLGETCFELSLEPSATGTLCRLVQFPPDSEYLDNVNAAEGFETLGSDGMESMTGHEESPHPLMHKSNTVDYIFIISGEIYAVMENGETLLHAGDMLIQRGTNHAWSNRSDQPCIMACVLNGAK